MDLTQFKTRIGNGKYGLVRRFPEVGADERFGMVMDVVVSGKRLAVVLGNDEESGPGPYRVREIHVGELINLGDDEVVIGEPLEWPVTTWHFSKQLSGAVDEWDARHTDYHDFEDAAEAQAAQLLAGPPLPVPGAPTNRFKFVRWSVVAGGQAFPAGVILRHPDGGLRAEEFPGHENAADFWSSRYTFVPENFLEDINHASGRTEMFSEPETIRAPSFEEALDRAKYTFAKDHYAETGRSLY